MERHIIRPRPGLPRYFLKTKKISLGQKGTIKFNLANVGDGDDLEKHPEWVGRA